MIEIEGKEYFYDADFNKLLDSSVNYVGYKLNGKYIFYDDVNKGIGQIQTENAEVEKILKNFGFGKKCKS